MSGIYVLSDILKGGNKLEKASTPKGEDVLDSHENVAAVFAAMLSGFMNSNVDSKGQNSKAGQDIEGTQSADNSVQRSQNSIAQGNVLLGYGNYALPFISQPMLQSDFPAGKEANSGNVVSQGNGGLATTNASLTNAPIVSGNNVGLAMLNFASLFSDKVFTSTGMTTPKPQGANPGITELDKYRQFIANLLVELSGEITDPSLKGTSLSSEIVQSWITVTNDVVNNGSVFPNQKVIQPLLDVLLNTGFSSGDPLLNVQDSTLQAPPNPLLNQEVKNVKTPLGVNGTLKAEGSTIEPAAEGSSELHVQHKSDVLGPQENNTSKFLLGAFREKVQKSDSKQSAELSGVKDVQNPNSSAGIRVASNLLATNVADGKTVAIPVWEQISTSIRGQVLNRHQDLKELDIQLYPVDLGKIQIAMRWENGQVHLVVQASEAATGQLLQKQLSDLRLSLTDQGVNCGMLQMGQGGDQRQNHGGDEPQRMLNHNFNLNEDEDPVPVIRPFSLEQDGNNRINVTA